MLKKVLGERAVRPRRGGSTVFLSRKISIFAAQPGGEQDTKTSLAAESVAHGRKSDLLDRTLGELAPKRKTTAGIPEVEEWPRSRRSGWLSEVFAIRIRSDFSVRAAPPAFRGFVLERRY